MTAHKHPLTLLLVIAIVSTLLFLPIREAGSSPDKIYGGQAGTLDSNGVPYTDLSPGDFSSNTPLRAFVKFSLSGVSGTLSSATLNLYLDSSVVDSVADTSSPLQNPGLGDCRVIHIADFGTFPLGADFNAPSIGNDPGLLISGSASPSIGFVSINVKDAVQDDINKGRSFSAFMIVMTTNTDSDGKGDFWHFPPPSSGRLTTDPFIEYFPSIPVGGITVPTNKLEILTPYLTLAGLAAAISVIVVVKRRKD